MGATVPRQDGSFFSDIERKRRRYWPRYLCHVFRFRVCGVPFVPKSRQRVRPSKTVDRSSSIFTADYWNKLIKGEGFVDTIRTVYYDRRKIHFTLTPELMFNYGRTYQMWGDVRNSYKINQMLFPIVVKYYPFGYRDRSMAKGLSLQLVPMGTYMMGFQNPVLATALR